MDVNRCFENALDELLVERNIDEITVKDIVARSGLGRSTFYKYNIDKYDLLNRMVKRTMDQTMFALDEYHYRDAMARFFAEVEKKKTTYANAFSSEDENAPLRYMADCSIAQMQKMYRKMGLDPEEPVRKIVMRTVVNNGNLILRDWANGKIAESRETVLIGLFASIPEEMKWLMENQKE